MPKQTFTVTTDKGEYDVDVDVPMATPDPNAWSQGFHQSLQDQAKASMAGTPGADKVLGVNVGMGAGRLPATVVGAVEGFPGVVKGAWETLKLPFTLAKGVLGGTADLINDPAGTLAKMRDTIAGLPESAKQKLNDAIELYQNDPEGFAKAAVELGASAAGAEVAGATIPIRSGVRMTGKALEAVGEHPLMARLAGGGMAARGVVTGNMPLAAAGVGTMAIPAAMKGTGRFLRRLSGEDLSAALPSGARTLDVGDTSTLEGIRVQPPAGPASSQTAIPGSPTGPAPYRSAARRAVLATEHTGEGTAAAETAEQPIMVGGRLVDPANPETRRLYDLAVGTTPGTPPRTAGVRLGGRSVPTIHIPPGMATKAAEMGNQTLQTLRDAGYAVPEGGFRSQADIDALEASIGTTAPDLRRVPTGRRALPGARNLEVVENASPPAAGEETGVTRAPAPAARAAIEGEMPVPADVMPTKPTIRVGGKGGAQIIATPPIKTVPPELEKLWTAHGAEEAGTKFASAHPDAFPKGLSKTARTNLVREAFAKHFDRYDAGGVLPESAQADIDAKLASFTNEADKRAYLLKAPNAAAFNYIWKMLQVGSK